MAFYRWHYIVTGGECDFMANWPCYVRYLWWSFCGRSMMIILMIFLYSSVFAHLEECLFVSFLKELCSISEMCLQSTGGSEILS